MSFFTNHLWKIATAFAGVASLALMVMLFVSYSQNRAIEKQRSELQAQITDPKTGYVARLTQATANVVTLKAAIAEQNVKYEQLSVASKRQLADSERRLAAAQAQTRVMERKISGFLATKPKGATLEERIRDIDQRAMTEFVQ